MNCPPNMLVMVDPGLCGCWSAKEPLCGRGGGEYMLADGSVGCVTAVVGVAYMVVGLLVVIPPPWGELWLAGEWWECMSPPVVSTFHSEPMTPVRAMRTVTGETATSAEGWLACGWEGMVMDGGGGCAMVV